MKKKINIKISLIAYLIANGVSVRAGKKRCRFFLIKADGLTLVCTSFLRSLLYRSSVMLRYKKYHQFSLIKATGEEVKRFDSAVKTSTNTLKH